MRPSPCAVTGEAQSKSSSAQGGVHFEATLLFLVAPVLQFVARREAGVMTSESPDACNDFAWCSGCTFWTSGLGIHELEHDVDASVSQRQIRNVVRH
jgi:hypothetical protein